MELIKDKFTRKYILVLIFFTLLLVLAMVIWPNAAVGFVCPLLIVALWDNGISDIVYHRTGKYPFVSKKSMEYHEEYKREQDRLYQILTEKGENSVSDEAVKAIRQRLDTLNKYLASHITGVDSFDSQATTESEQMIKDRKAFMNNTRLAYEASNPAFIQYLREKGLDDDQLNYCCLYLLGLRSKEIGAYLGKRSHYNVASEIRKKLGLDMGNANLGIYLRKLSVQRNFSSANIQNLDNMRRVAWGMSAISTPAEFAILAYIGLKGTVTELLAGVIMVALALIFISILVYGLIKLGKEMFTALRMAWSVPSSNFFARLWICCAFNFIALICLDFISPEARHVCGYIWEAISWCTLVWAALVPRR